MPFPPKPVFWASFAKIDPFWPEALFWVDFAKITPFCHFEQLFLKSSRFCLKRRFWAGFAKLHSFEQRFPDLRNFEQNHCLKELLPKKAIFAKTTAVSIFCQKKRLWPKPLFWVSFAEIQPFWQKHTVLSRFRQNNAIWRFCHFEQLFLKSSRFCLKRRFWAGFAEIEPVWQIKQFPAAFPRLKQFPKITVLRSFYQKKAIFAKTTVLSIFAIFPFCAALSKSQPFLPQKVAAHDPKWAFCTIFMESALFSSFEENFRPVWRILRTLMLKNAI